MKNVSFLDMFEKLEDKFSVVDKNNYHIVNENSSNKLVHVLIHGMEHHISFNKSETNKIFQIYMPGKDYPFWMYITPCDGTLHWQLYMKNEFGKKDNTYEALNKIKKKKYNWDNQQIIHIEKNLKDVNLILLAGQSNSKRMKFYAKDIESDLLFLNVTSYDCPSFKVLFTTIERQIDEYYAPLPDDTTVHFEVTPHYYDKNINKMINVEFVDIKLSWANDSKFENGRHKYCAVITKNFIKSSMCFNNRISMDKMHCDSKNKNKIFEENMQIILYIFDIRYGSVNAFSPVQLKKEDIKFKIPYSNIILNRNNSTSITTKTVTKMLSILESSQIILPDGVLYEASFNKNDNILQNFNFTINPNISKKNNNETEKILLIINGCSGYIKLAIYRGNVLLRKTEEITGFRRFLIMNVNEGNLRFEITNIDGKDKQYKIWASSKPIKSPYPQLPSEPSLKIIHRSCKTVTIQWFKAIDKKINYCMYKYPLNETNLNKISFKSDPTLDYCYPKLFKKNMIGCYTSYGVEKDVYNPKGIASNSLIEATLEDLIPNQVYKFEMFATKKVGKKYYHLPYRALITKTMKHCNN
uniref:NDNF_C domain-containing protein n=1 Tax=Strongyloides stercoralis TaxID=6248 RepID=A0A0K0DSZ6_STRER